MSDKQQTSEEELNENNFEVSEKETASESDQEIVEEKVEPTIEDKLIEANEKFIRLYAEFEN